MYHFVAERLNVGVVDFGNGKDLKPNAENLPVVLNTLQSNSVKFGRFNRALRQIFPDVQKVSVCVDASNRLQILVWSGDEDSEREDLAIPLQECGSGLSQVLAILYVVLTSEYSRIIAIDEPQSFLHPGALRTLLGLMRSEASHEHQYVISTHSPMGIVASEPSVLLVVTKQNAETNVQPVSAEEVKTLRLALAEVGARPSDVLSADSVVWVEGATEEQCFPLIHRRLNRKSLFGVAILGVRNTGDFEGKKSKSTFDVYRRLAQSSVSLPTTVRFIFDREGKSDTERCDLDRQSHGTVKFLSRRMYENYLLSSSAIAKVLSRHDEVLRDRPFESLEFEVDQWIDQATKSNKYLPSGFDHNGGNYLEEVDGAKLLRDLFRSITEQRYDYEKIDYGLELTELILDEAPDSLSEIANLLDEMLNEDRAQIQDEI